MQENSANFNFSWNSHENYWICVVLEDSENLDRLSNEFTGSGISASIIDAFCLAIHAPKDWAETWAYTSDILTKNSFSNPKIAIIPDDGHRPAINFISSNLESVETIHSVSKNLWLLDALNNNRIECHFQPIIDRTNKPFGYEAFVRARLETGEIIGGAKIIQAARDLNIEHVLDKKLHILAVKTFAEAHLEGSLFINFMAGFIQLPAKYLEGLDEAVKHYDILAKRIVLDVADAENVRDLNQIASIINYSNSKGYSLALDDINSYKSLSEMLFILGAKPDFIKLDRKLTQDCDKSKTQKEISKLSELAHSNGSMILAEGIESDVMQKSLMGCAIDLFQGYYISAPKPVRDIVVTKQAS